FKIDRPVVSIPALVCNAGFWKNSLGPCGESLTSAPSSALDGGARAHFPQWILGRLSVSSLVTGHLWSLFADLPRVNDEFERVSILNLFHQLEVDKPFGVSHGSAVLEPASG